MMFRKILMCCLLYCLMPLAHAHIGKFAIQNAGSRQCIGVGTATVAASATLQQVACAPKSAPRDPKQLWRFVEGTGQNSDEYYILSESTAQCLSAGRNGVVELTACDTTTKNRKNQLFLLVNIDTSVSGTQASKNMYWIMSTASLQCLSGKSVVGTNTSASFTTQVCNNGENQRFILNKMGARNHHQHHGGASSSSSSGTSSSSGDTSSSSGSTSSSGGSSSGSCSTTPDSPNATWRPATLTNYESYPAPGSDECVNYNGCKWAGQFAGLDGKQSLSWVKSHNILSVHEKDFPKYKGKTLRLKMGSKQIDGVVYDECADSDCNGCCTKNAGKNGFLIDMEKYTAQRFGTGDGTVQWTCLDCDGKTLPPKDSCSTSSSGSGSSSGSSGSSSGGWTPPGGGQKDQKISGVYITWYGFDDNSCETEAQHTCDNIAFPKKDGFPTVHNTTMEDLGTYHNPITLATAANGSGKGGPWPVGTLFYVPMVHKYFVMEDSCLECTQDWKKHKYHVDLYMGPNAVGGSNLIHCEEALTTTSTIIVNPSEGYPVEIQKIYTPGNCTSKHKFPVDVTPGSSSSGSTSSGSSGTSSGGSSSGSTSSSSSGGSSSSSSGSVDPNAVMLKADGTTDAYKLINDTLNAPAETPDCGHKEFGPHITQAQDPILNRPVFLFHAHVDHDNDRCVNFDRSRIEIKTFGGSPDKLKGHNGDTVTFSWKFKLDAGFKPSSHFTHIHQIKAGDGDDGMPIITITPRASGANGRLQIIHSPSGGGSVLADVDLAPFKGVWVHAYEKIKYGSSGSYSLTLTPAGGKAFSYSNANLNLWRNGATFVRPKWGLYRSLLDKNALRDEIVRFNDFCLAKGTASCPTQ